MFEVSSLQNVMTRVPAAQRPHNTTVSCVNWGCYGGMDSVYPGVDPTSTRTGASVGVRGLKAIYILIFSQFSCIYINNDILFVIFGKRFIEC